MAKGIVPHNAIVFVGDGRKALLLCNDGDEKIANLKALNVQRDENPPTHEQGTDRPGRGFRAAHASRRSAMEPTDWHEIEEHRFARHMSETLERLVRERDAPAVVIVAPSRTLADLREALHPDVRAKVTREINKDLTKIPVWEIEKHIFV